MSKSSLQKTVALLSAAALAAAVNAVQADENTPAVTANPAPVESSAAEAKPTTAASPTEATATKESTDPSSAISPENASGNTDALMAMSQNVAATEDTKPVEGQTVDVRILATTDLHTNLVNYDYYQDKPVETLGLAKTAVLIEKAKKENPNVLLVTPSRERRWEPIRPLWILWRRASSTLCTLPCRLWALKLVRWATMSSTTVWTI